MDMALKCRTRHLLALLCMAAVGAAGASARAGDAAGASGRSASSKLTIVIVRHGEKPADGDNLSCQGLHRALALPAVLFKKFGRPDWAYAAQLEQGGSTQHARMFQTLAPYAVQQGLTVNTGFAEGNVKAAAADVLQRSGLVLMVWEHSQIPPLAQALGVAKPPSWGKDDFDSIWVVTPSGGKATLSVAAEGLHPAADCKF